MKYTTGLNLTLVVLAIMNTAMQVTALAASDPENAQAPVTPLPYKSPFQDYRPLGEDKRIPWKAANDQVGKIGGWRVYAREASQSLDKRDIRESQDAGESKSATDAPSPASNNPSSKPVPTPNAAPVLAPGPVQEKSSASVTSHDAKHLTLKPSQPQLPEAKK